MGLPFVQFVGDAEVVEIDGAASDFVGVVEEREPVAHEVRQGVGHVQRNADGGPFLPVQTVVERGSVGSILEVALRLQVDGRLFQGACLTVHYRFVSGYYVERLLPFPLVNVKVAVNGKDAFVITGFGCCDQGGIR